MRFQRIVILGNGKIAVDCLCALLDYVDRAQIFVIESQYSPVSLLKKNCEKNNVRYFPAKEVIAALEQLIVPQTFVMSANNTVIIPREICESNMVEIINFHYSFLPDYKGVNIPSWVIFNREEFTGVTWHYVNAELDAGEDERINGIKNGKEDYFPLMAELGRIFEHTKVMEKHVYPAIQESIHPDVLTYAFAFMVLF